eukprot:scaffold1940_cov112-Isochrysis_galbana.AAC.9
MVPRSGGYPPLSVSDRLGKWWEGKRHVDKWGPVIEGDEGGMIGDGASVQQSTTVDGGVERSTR